MRNDVLAIDYKDSIRGTYTMDDIEDTLRRMDIPYNWIDYSDRIDFIDIPGGESMYRLTYMLFDKNNISVPVLEFDCIYAGGLNDNRYWLYLDNKMKLITGIILEYEKCLKYAL